jgi:N-acetyl-1-D-myo-inositol-2-amino-2-deoxy-alpha-D-glucopyranoside deacetylase
MWTHMPGCWLRHSCQRGASCSTNLRLSCGILAVLAHPDDESIACGGLLARCADHGARVSLICATHGENHEGVRDGHWYEERPKELRHAARILGIDDVIVYDYPDGFLPWIDRAEFQARVQAAIERLAPAVVVTFGRDGLYWHPDHIAVCDMTTAAAAALGERSPALYHVTMPHGLMRRLADEFRDHEGSNPLLGILDPDAYGVSAGSPTLIVDVAACAGRKLAALKCHRTQVAGGPLDRIPESEAARVFVVEHFHRTPFGGEQRPFIETLGTVRPQVSLG